MMARWWERDPARYASEIRELNRAGFRYVINDAAKARGYLRIDVFPVVDGEELPLIAVFPDLYPWFRFEVKAPTANLPYHQHPFAKTLCMLPRDTMFWRGGSDRLAHFLRDRLELVLASGKAELTAGIVEEHQAEPYTDYYQYAAGGILLLDGQWRLPADNSFGTATIQVESPAGAKPAPLLRGALVELRNERNDVLYSAPDVIVQRYSCSFEARWAKRETPPTIGDPRLIFEALAEGDQRGSRLVENRVQGGTLSIRIGLFPEEHRWRGAGGAITGQGWLVGCRFQGQSVKEHQGGAKQRGRVVTRHPKAQPYLARVGRYTLADVLERAPELRPLLTKSVTIIGLGCIGAPSALELARAGITDIRIADFDYFDPATSLRWPRGLSAAGFQKSAVLEQQIKADYPLTRIRSQHVRLGSVTEGAQDDWSIVDELLEGTNLLYDASSEPAVQYFLAMQAQVRGIPYVCAFGTQGGFGGALVRIRPGQTAGCWMCYLNSSADGRLPVPPARPDDQGRVQPTGCADSTFVGAGFDLAELALSGARLVTSTLGAGEEGGYPEMQWDVAVLRLRDDAGRAIAPTWITSALEKHPGCPVCNPIQ